MVNSNTLFSKMWSEQQFTILVNMVEQQFTRWVNMVKKKQQFTIQVNMLRTAVDHTGKYGKNSN